MRVPVCTCHRGLYSEQTRSGSSHLWFHGDDDTPACSRYEQIRLAVQAIIDQHFIAAGYGTMETASQLAGEIAGEAALVLHSNPYTLDSILSLRPGWAPPFRSEGP